MGDHHCSFHTAIEIADHHYNSRTTKISTSDGGLITTGGATQTANIGQHSAGVASGGGRSSPSLNRETGNLVAVLQSATFNSDGQWLEQATHPPANDCELSPSVMAFFRRWRDKGRTSQGWQRHESRMASQNSSGDGKNR